MPTPTHAELTALRDNDPALCMAMVSAGENADDLGLEPHSEEWDAEVARQVAGWLDAGREW